DWDERKSPELSVKAIAAQISSTLSSITDATALALVPPPVQDLGESSGFDCYLKDDLGQGHEALMAARTQLLALARNDKRLANVRAVGDEDTPQFHLDMDSRKVGALGLSMADVNQTLGIAWGGSYVDDFIDRAHVKHVYVQG